MTARHTSSRVRDAATSVVEVGLDVPNATLMTIESGHRFGLAQLHQLQRQRAHHVGQAACLGKRYTLRSGKDDMHWNNLPDEGKDRHMWLQGQLNAKFTTLLLWNGAGRECPKIALLRYRRLRSASAVDFSTRSLR